MCQYIRMVRCRRRVKAAHAVRIRPGAAADDTTIRLSAARPITSDVDRVMIPRQPSVTLPPSAPPALPRRRRAPRPYPRRANAAVKRARALGFWP